MIDIRQLIGGDSLPAAGGDTLDGFEPATGQVYSTIPRGGPGDVEAAVAAARKAFPVWAHTPAEERSRLMLRLADRLEDQLERFARAETVDNGKPLELARTVDIPRAVANLRFFATAILHFHSEAHATDYAAINYTLRRPRGVAGCISPWNLPLYLFTWKIAPALATGNTVVAKPSELTPMTAFMLGELTRECGWPEGVLNIVHGLGAEVGAALTAHPDVTTIAFTGGTVTGETIARTTAPMFKKVALEMGGKNPTLVFADNDLDSVVRAATRAAYTNQGQICLCGSRILVEQAIYEPFVERMTAALNELTIGDPLEAGTDQGALVSAAHRDKVRGYIELALQEGGSAVTGGLEPPEVPARCRDGYFVRPTLLTGLDNTCRVHQEEIFGPVAGVIPFRDEQHALELANDSRYGLASSIWTRNLSQAHRVAEKIETGTVWVNCWLFRDLRVPFGGMKQSGVEREGGDEALRFFTEPKNVCIHIPDAPSEASR